MRLKWKTIWHKCTKMILKWAKNGTNEQKNGHSNRQTREHVERWAETRHFIKMLPVLEYEL